MVYEDLDKYRVIKNIRFEIVRKRCPIKYIKMYIKTARVERFNSYKLQEKFHLFTKCICYFIVTLIYTIFLIFVVYGIFCARTLLCLPEKKG